MDASGSDSQVLADGRGGTDVAPADGAGDPETGRADACVPYCEEWWECGNDGCGGKCGDGCQAGETCFEFGCVEQGTDCDDGNAIPWDGCTNGHISEFVVNSYQTMDQVNPDVAALTNGGYVVVWASCPDPDPDDGGTWAEGQDGSGCGIYGQLFDEDGNAFLNEFLVNWNKSYHQRAPRVVALDDGAFMVLWKGWEDIEGWQSHARTFDEFSNPVSDEWQVSTALDALEYDAEPAMCAFPGGRFAAAWDQWDEIDEAYNVVYVTMEADGEQATGEWELQSEGSEGFPDLVALPDETVLALWSADQGATGSDIVGRILDFAGEEPGDEFIVNTGLADAQYYPAGAWHLGGGFMVAWQSDSVDGDATGVAVRLYDETGHAPQSETLANYTTAGEQGRPDVAAYGDYYVVVWHHDGPDDDGHAVMGQLFEADGTKTGAEFRANYYDADMVGPPAVAATGDGFVVVWHSCWGQDDTGCGIFAQRYGPAGEKLVR